MNTASLFLYVKGRPNEVREPRDVGRLILVSISPETASFLGMRLAFESALNSNFLSQHAPAHWVSLKAEVWSQTTDPRSYGQIEIDSNHQAPDLSGVDGRIEWQWLLRSENLEAIHSDRAALGHGPVRLMLRFDGAFQGKQGVFMVDGRASFEIPLSEWEVSLARLGYGVSPSAAGLIGSASSSDESWRDAGERLARARKHLRAGETREALTACLDAFGAVVHKPYDKKSWLTRFNEPDQKIDGLTAALAGHCSYLNKVGYHRARDERDEDGNLMEMPLDHWEAELAVGASHFWLAYALRAVSETGRSA